MILDLAQMLRELDDTAIVLEPREFLDDAIAGVAHRSGMLDVLVYDYDDLVLAFMRMHGWASKQAGEWVDLNVIGVCSGLGTPIVMDSLVRRSEGI